MNAAARVHDALLPQPPGGTGAGAVLALLVHAGLVFALTVSVGWRASSPDVVAAELWASVPQVAAPQAESAPQPEPPAPVAVAPPPPQPAPPQEADIATERAQKKKAEEDRKREQAEAERRKEQAEAERRKREKAEAVAREKAEKEEERRLAQQREENLRRMLGQAGGGTGGSGTAAREAAPSAAYAGRIVAAVRKNITFTGAAATEATTEVEVRTAPGGTILSARIVKASGHKDWDEAVMRGLDKTGKLPTDTDGRVPAVLLLVFRPTE